MALVAEYSFNASGTSFVDSSGNGHTLTAASGHWILGHTSSGLQGAASGSVTTSPPAVPTQSAGSILWWHQGDVSSWDWIVGPSGGLRVGATIDAGVLYLEHHTGGASTGATSLPVSSGDGQWHHYAITWASSTAIPVLYVDGVSQGPFVSYSGTMPNFAALASGTPTISLFDVSWYAENGQSVIDDWRLFNTALSSTDINTYMNTPAGSSPPTPVLIAEWAFSEGSGSTAADTSGNGYNYAGVPGWSTSAPLGGETNSAVFTGTSTTARSIGSTLTTFTVMGWIYVTANGHWHHIISDPTGHWSQLLVYDGPYPGFYTGDNFGNIDVTSGSSISLNAWHHIAASFDGSAAIVYVDGSVVTARGGLAGTFASSVNSGDDVYGRLRDVRIFSGVLSATDISTWKSTPAGGSPGAPIVVPNIAMAPRTLSYSY